MTYTISRLGELFGISRATLLYYERLGLFSASGRTKVSYRVFSEENRERLEKIMRLRAIGIPLKQISRFLLKPGEGILPLLLNRLLPLNAELENLAKQQTILLEMIENEGTLRGKKPFLAAMKRLGKQAGIHRGNFESVHRVLEKTSPKAHRRFLEFLGFSRAEIKEFIKQISKND